MIRPQWKDVAPAKRMFEHWDRMRRWRGEMFDAVGFGPLETHYKVSYSTAGLNLRRYGNEKTGSGPTLLIVPAPIKRAYIWDLAPEISVVRRCLDQGMRVYLAEWTEAGDGEPSFGLKDYGSRLLMECAEAIEMDGGDAQLILAGHSLGGVLATIFSCLHPRQVRALLLLEAPLHFGADAGDFAPLVAATPDAAPIEATFGEIPGSFLNLVSGLAAPHAFQWERHLDLALAMTNPAAFATHMRVERWTHDEFPMPGKLFTEIVERLYRDDQLMKGSLRVAGREIGPHDVTAPLLNVIDPRSTVIPPQSILSFHDAAASPSKKLLRYGGDIGVGIQHVGVLVGAAAHARIWPAIFDWLSDLDAGR